MSAQEGSRGAIVRAPVGPCPGQTVTCNALAMGLSPGESNRLDALSIPRTVKRGAYLVHVGDTFHSLHLVDRGLMKGVMAAADGREQVAAFYLPGEPLGLEAIGRGMHGHSVVALEESHVRAIPYDALERLSRALPVLQRNLSRMMSGEIVRSQGIMLLLGGMRAEQRVAAVLLGLSRRLEMLGRPALIDLHITRRDLGSYIGLSMETVSRVLSRMEKWGHISLQERNIELLDSAAVERLVQAEGREQAVRMLRLARIDPEQRATAVAATAQGISLRHSLRLAECTQSHLRGERT